MDGWERGAQGHHVEAAECCPYNIQPVGLRSTPAPPFPPHPTHVITLPLKLRIPRPKKWLSKHLGIEYFPHFFLSGRSGRGEGGGAGLSLV